MAPSLFLVSGVGDGGGRNLIQNFHSISLNLFHANFSVLLRLYFPFSCDYCRQIMCQGTCRKDFEFRARGKCSSSEVGNYKRKNSKMLKLASFLGPWRCRDIAVSWSLVCFFSFLSLNLTFFTWSTCVENVFSSFFSNPTFSLSNSCVLYFDS